MDIQVFRCAAAFVVSVSLVASACSGTDSTLLQSPAAPLSTDSLRVTAEPDRIVPEVLSTRECPDFTPVFRARLNLIVSAARHRAVRGILFDFVDRFGNRAVPTLLPTPSAFLDSSSAGIPAAVPLPIPSGTVLPIPGTTAFNGLMLNGTRTLPFLLEFRCSVRPAGTLSIGFETEDDLGTIGVSRLNVRIGE
jgi:hypothetical protein